MRTSEKIGWLLIGAAIGAGIALLYAPKTGRETRKYIRRKAEDARETLVETGEQIRDTVVETTESVVDAGRQAYRKGAEFASGAAEVIDRGRKRVIG